MLSYIKNKKGKVKMVAFFLVCVLVLLLDLYLVSAADKPIVLRYSSIFTPEVITAKDYAEGMAREIEKRTNGQVKVQIYWRDALAKSQDNYEAVKSGVADMADFAHSWIPGKFPLSDVANLPFAVSDPYILSPLMKALEKKGYFQKEWAEVEVLGWCATMPYVCFFKKLKPMKFEDLAGLKVRTPGGVITDMLKAFGMVPVQVFLGDAYMAWERGLIEAWHHSPGAAMDYGLYQAGLKSVLCYNTNIYTGQLIFNKKKLASLPQEIQGIIRKVGAEFDKVWVDSGKRRAEEAMALYRKVGADIYNWPEPEMNKLRNAAVPIWKKFIEDKEARGLPGRQLVRDFVNIAKEMGQKPIYSPE